MSWVDDLYEKMFGKKEEHKVVIPPMPPVKPTKKDISTPVLEIASSFLNNPKRWRIRWKEDPIPTLGESYRHVMQRMIRSSSCYGLVSFEITAYDTKHKVSFDFRFALRENVLFTNFTYDYQTMLLRLLEHPDPINRFCYGPTWMTEDEREYLCKLFLVSFVREIIAYYEFYKRIDRARAAYIKEVEVLAQIRSRQHFTELYKGE